MAIFKITNKAREDLIDIARFTESKWGLDQRRFYLRQLDLTFHALADNPHLGQACNEIRQDYFKYSEGSHVIFFRLSDEECIEIVRILHKRMDVVSHF